MRVDPPAGPIHTRPYGPARRALVAKYAGQLTEKQAAEIRDLMRARLPGWDVLIADAARWTFQPLTDPPDTAESSPL